MSEEKIVYLAIILVLVSFLLVYILVRRIYERSKEINQELELYYKDQIRKLSKVGVISGASKVPGIIALVSDKIIYRSYLLNFSGEIYLSQIEKVDLKKYLSTKYNYKEWTPGKKVLEIYHNQGVSKFFISVKEADEWFQVLNEFASKA